MKVKIPSVLCCFLAAVFTVAIASCATEGSFKIITSGSLPKQESNIFELQIQTISISNVPMSRALNMINDSIKAAPGSKISFDYAIEYSDSKLRSDNIHLHDHKVSIHASNTTLGETVDELCKQSGWSYRWSNGYIYFIDDNHNHFTWHDAPHDWLGWSFQK